MLTLNLHLLTQKYYTTIVILLQILRNKDLRIPTNVPFRLVFIIQICTIGFLSEESAIINHKNPTPQDFSSD